MAIVFKKATKAKAKLRMAICGPAGGGKTYTSIKVAKHLIGEPYKLPDGTASRIVVLDSERNRAEKYADEFDFMHAELGPESWSSASFTTAINEAEDIADVVIVDSITHEWKWCLAEVDRIAPRFRNNTWSAWSEITPKHDTFIDAIMSSSAHVIATMRSKQATVQEKDDRGKTVVRKVGMESVQRDDLDYAFDIVLSMDNEHNGMATKTTARALDKRVFPEPGEEFAKAVSAWLNSGDAPTERPKRIARPAEVTEPTTEATSEEALVDESIRVDLELAASKEQLAAIVSNKLAPLKLAKDSPRRARLMSLYAVAEKRIANAVAA